MRPGTRRYRLALPAAVAAVLLLLGLLATLQYRWAGELGEAERLRLRAGVQARADALSRDFDVEVTRAFVQLQMDGPSLRSGDFAEYADRYDAWGRTAADPALVKDVLLLEQPEDEAAPLRVSRFVPARRTFEAADWPPSLVSIRRWGEGFSAGQDGHAAFRHRAPRDRILQDVPALILPIFDGEDRGEWREGRHHGPPPPPAGFVLVVLGPDSLLATLASRHFGGAGGLDYDLTIVSSRDTADVRWRSRPEAGVAQPDASAGLLDLRFEEISQAEQRTLPRRPLPREGQGRWRLLVSHRAGPLDAVVAAARRRNLAVSFGILVLLGASVALVVASALRARRLGQKQMEFVAAVSHELRTPVAVICSSAENLADGIVTEPKEVRVYGSMLRDQGRRLGRMVEQVLEFAGSSAARTARREEEVDVARLLEEALQPFEGRLRDEGFTVEKETEPGLPPVRGDAHALRHAVQNLIENAVKYDAGARWLAVRANRAAGSAEVEITVEDRGKGIAPADLSHVFEPFFRGGEAQDGSVRGFGLGLALVRRVVEDHGGRVGVSSAPGRGTTFTITLPALRAEARAGEAADALPHPSR